MTKKRFILFLILLPFLITCEKKTVKKPLDDNLTEITKTNVNEENNDNEKNNEENNEQQDEKTLIIDKTVNKIKKAFNNLDVNIGYRGLIVNERKARLVLYQALIDKINKIITRYHEKVDLEPVLDLIYKQLNKNSKYY